MADALVIRLVQRDVASSVVNNAADVYNLAIGDVRLARGSTVRSTTLVVVRDM